MRISHLAVLRTMSRDDRIYDNPDEFIPERFMDLTPERMELCDPSKFVFGHGRRYAEFIAVVSFIQASIADASATEYVQDDSLEKGASGLPWQVSQPTST